MKQRPPTPHCLSRQHPQLARQGSAAKRPLSGRAIPLATVRTRAYAQAFVNHLSQTL